MSKRRANNLNELSKKWIYRTQDGLLVWLTSDLDRAEATHGNDCELWHIAYDGSGTWRVYSKSDMYPMYKVAKLDDLRAVQEGAYDYEV